MNSVDWAIATVVNVNNSTTTIAETNGDRFLFNFFSPG